MSFEGFMSNEYCLYLADTDATYTFVSRQYCSFHNMQFVSMSAKCSLANDSDVAVVGYIDVFIKLGALRKHRVLAVDFPPIYAVLGMDFLAIARKSMPS
jgi:hypothetical protein